MLMRKEFFFFMPVIFLLPLFDLPTDFYTAPTILLFLFLCGGLDFPLIKKFISDFKIVLIGFLFALCSALWSLMPGLVVKNFFDIIMLPIFSFLAGFLLIKKYGKIDLFVRSMFVWFFIIFFAFIVYLAAGGLSLFSVGGFYWSNGYFTTYSFIIFAAIVPFIRHRYELFFYIFVMAFMFWSSMQRISWMFFPVFGVLALFYFDGKFRWRQVLFFLAFCVISFIFLKGLQEIRPADAFSAAAPKEKMSLIEYLLANERLRIWQEWLVRASNNLILGLGYGRDVVLQTLSMKETWSESKLYHAHNIFINYLMQLGLIGVFLLVFGYSSLIKFFFNYKKPAAHAAIFVLVFYVLRNMVDHYEYKRIMMFYFSILGVLTAACMYDSDATAKTK